MRKSLALTIFILLTLTAGCRSQSGPSADNIVPRSEVIEMLCGEMPETQCLDRVCADHQACPLLTALSDGAVFNFVETYAQCEGCNTPWFFPQDGIGKCIEYQVEKTDTGWMVTFWVSENCNFRHASPTESRVSVEVDAAVKRIAGISPPAEYLLDPLYCQANADCRDLSGSGVPFVGCANNLHAPLHWSGYGPRERCGCKAGQCLVE